MTSQSTFLFSRHAGADKVYNVYLKPKDGGWTVDYAHGARGKALKTGSKTPSPVSYEVALKKYKALIAEKMNGDSHYQVGEGGATYADIADSGTPFGIYPQQPTPISRTDLEMLIDNPEWGIQEKANGENRLIRVSGQDVHGGNKKGLKIASIPSEWITQFRAFGDFVANGEHVGDRFLAFDLLELNGKDLRGLPQRQRYDLLVQMQRGTSHVAPAFGIIECHYSMAAKKQCLHHIESTRLEGVVAKNANAPYVQGRSVDTLKFKFIETVTCIVIGHNLKRSVQIALLDAKQNILKAGNVTIPANKPIPELDGLVDVQFLYWSGNAFEQPIYDPDDKGLRLDIDREECTLDQITRFKPSEQDVDPFANDPAMRQEYA